MKSRRFIGKRRRRAARLLQDQKNARNTRSVQPVDLMGALRKALDKVGTPSAS